MVSRCVGLEVNHHLTYFLKLLLDFIARSSWLWVVADAAVVTGTNIASFWVLKLLLISAYLLLVVLGRFVFCSSWASNCWMRAFCIVIWFCRDVTWLLVVNNCWKRLFVVRFGKETLRKASENDAGWLLDAIEKKSGSTSGAAVWLLADAWPGAWAWGAKGWESWAADLGLAKRWRRSTVWPFWANRSLSLHWVAIAKSWEHPRPFS